MLRALAWPRGFGTAQPRVFEVMENDTERIGGHDFNRARLGWWYLPSRIYVSKDEWQNVLKLDAVAIGLGFELINSPI